MRFAKKVPALLLVLIFLFTACVSCMGDEPDYTRPDLDVSSYHKNYQFKYYTRWLTEERIGQAADQLISSGGARRSEFLALGRQFRAFGDLIEKSFSKEEGAGGTASYLQSVGDAFLLFENGEISADLTTEFINRIAVARTFLNESETCSPVMKKARVCTGWICSASPETLSTAFTKPNRDPDTMVITFGGNTFLGNREDDWSSGFNAAYAENKDQLFYPFADVRNYFLQDDLTLVTYTGSISKTEGVGKDGRNGFDFYAKRMAESGIDVVALNSEYAEEFYESGLQETDEAFRKAGIESYYDRKTAYINTKLGKMALISYNIVSTRPVLDGIIRLDMAEANRRGAKMIVVNFHWKAGKDGAVTKIQEKYARLASFLGADLVIGSHPDAVQGIAYTSKGRGIFYSAGNLLDGTDTDNRKPAGCLIQVTVRRRKGQYDFTDFHVIPLTRKDGDMKFSPAPADGREKEEMIDRINASSGHLKDGVRVPK